MGHGGLGIGLCIKTLDPSAFISLSELHGNCNKNSGRNSEIRWLPDVNELAVSCLRIGRFGREMVGAEEELCAFAYSGERMPHVKMGASFRVIRCWRMMRQIHLEWAIMCAEASGDTASTAQCRGNWPCVG